MPTGLDHLLEHGEELAAEALLRKSRILFLIADVRLLDHEAAEDGP